MSEMSNITNLLRLYRQFIIFKCGYTTNYFLMWNVLMKNFKETNGRAHCLQHSTFVEII